MLKVLFVIIGLVLSTISFASDRQTIYLVDFDPTNQELTAIPLNTIIGGASGHKRAWVIAVNKNKKIRYDLHEMFVDFNCTNSYIQGLQAHTYLKGQTISTFPSEKGGYVVPGTIGDNMYKFICTFDKNEPASLALFQQNFRDVSLNMVEMVTELQAFIIELNSYIK